MFTKVDAETIRANLGEPFDLSSPSQVSGLFAGYFSFYNFNQQGSFQKTPHYAGKISLGGHQVVVQYFQCTAEDNAGTVFLLHGYLDHVGLYQHIIDHCLSQGFNVVMFDQIGHGLSSGEPASIDSFETYSNTLCHVLQLAMKANLPRPWHAVGQSTGGAVIIDSLLKSRPEITDQMASYVLLAPLLRPFGWKKSRVLFAMSQPFLASSKRVFSKNSHDEKFLHFLKHEDPLQSKRLQRDWIEAMIQYQKDFAAAAPSNAPLKIIQGTDDTTVDWQYNIVEIQAKFPNTQTVLVQQARHHLVNENPSYRAQVFALVDRFLKAS